MVAPVKKEEEVEKSWVNNTSRRMSSLTSGIIVLTDVPPQLVAVYGKNDPPPPPKRPLEEQQSSSPTKKIKRMPSIVYMTPQEVEENSDKIVRISTSTGILLFMKLDATSYYDGFRCKIEELKRENKELQKQVSLFRQLLNNPERLTSVFEKLHGRPIAVSRPETSSPQ